MYNQKSFGSSELLFSLLVVVIMSSSLPFLQGDKILNGKIPKVNGRGVEKIFVGEDWSGNIWQFE